MKKKIAVLLPVYNEEKSLKLLKKELILLAKNMSRNFIFEFIWIDDGSTDRTPQIIDSFKNTNNRVLHFVSNFGKTNAILAGIHASNSDLVAVMDTDLQDNPKFIEQMVAFLIDHNYDFVIGNRVNRYDSNSIKKLSSYFIISVIRLFFSTLKVHDVNCGMKVMTSQVAKSIFLKSDYHRYMPLIAHLKGFRIGEIPVEQRPRKFGVSKYGSTGFMRIWKSLSDLLSIIFIFKLAVNPFSFFGKLGLASCAAGLLILSYLTILWFYGQPINSRPLFFLGILAITTGVNFLSLGLIGELIQLSNRNFEYSIRETGSEKIK
jgi:glycosyltransferase involved in cell wall biosynthesis